MIPAIGRRPRRGVLLALALCVPWSAAAFSGSGADMGRFHDDLTSASPGDGDTLGTVPDTLRLTFTRAQNLELASVELAGPSGPVALGSLREHPDSAAVVLVPTDGPWTAGAHTVRWRIVGQDGHPVSGEYTFVVADGATGLTPKDGASGAPVDADTATSRDGGNGAQAAGEGAFGVGSPAYVAVRWLTFAGLLGVIGAASWALLVLPMARRRDEGVDLGAERGGALPVAALGAGVLLLAAFVRLWAQAEALGDVGLLRSMLGATPWGAGWWLQVGGSVVALAALLWARRDAGRTLPWVGVGAAAVVLSYSPALSGHASAGGVPSWTFLADGVHVLVAGGWMGGLLFLVAASVPRALRREEVRVAPVVEAFSATALAFATLLVATGVFAAWQHMGSIEALWTSDYGKVLGVKLLVLLPLLATGAYNWLRVRPALSAGNSGARRIRKSGSVELAVAVVVLLVTAVLVATPPPGEGHAPESSGSSTSTQESP